MIPKRLKSKIIEFFTSAQPLCHTDSTRSSGLLCLEASKHQLTPRFIGCKFENIYSKGHSQPRRHVYYHPMTQYEFCGLSLSRKSRVSSAACSRLLKQSQKYRVLQRSVNLESRFQSFHLNQKATRIFLYIKSLKEVVETKDKSTKRLIYHIFILCFLDSTTFRG